MRQVRLLILAAFLVCGCAGHPVKSEDVLHDICRANHLFDLYQKERLRFTFNVRLPDKTVKRSWEWHIRSGEVFLNGEAHSQSAMFVNDIYWLLFPLKAWEDRGKTAVTVNRRRTPPLAGRELTEVVVRYVDGKGFTPNDAYRLYVDDNLMIREWGYLKEGREPPARMTTWEDYTDFDGVSLSLLREGPAGFRVWFTDVAVE
ncbi:hypothetical protein [Desulfococcus sp.]|uniref:hypothetical protein n=1 Tax=Desulfococcus sp. TaxID=2025834 RepID=UPI003593CB71